MSHGATRENPRPCHGTHSSLSSSQVIEILVLIILLLIVFMLLIVFRQKKPAQSIGWRKGRKSEEKTRPCPLCGSRLKKGERVRTVVLPGKADTLAEVYGCKYCFCERPTAVRICPVCLKPVPKDGYVIGRMFRERRHLHVLGCTQCRMRGGPRK